MPQISYATALISAIEAMFGKTYKEKDQHNKDIGGCASKADKDLVLSSLYSFFFKFNSKIEIKV